MRQLRNIAWIVFVLVLGFLACVPVEGLGGQSVITGRVQIIDCNMELTNYLGTYYAYDEDVYLIYGEDSIPSDDVKISYNGYYRFEYLQAGHYTVYSMSEDTTGESASGYYAVKKDVLIPDNGDEIGVEEIVIIK